MKRTVVICAALFLSLSARAQDNRLLREAILQCAAVQGVRVGVAARHLSKNRSVEINADSLFPTASVIKLPILVELFHQFETRRLDPLQKVTLETERARPGSGILQYLRGGAQLPLIDVATLMIILSDNTATNYVIDLLGAEHEEKLDAVNGRMRSLGLTRTKLLNKLYSWETKKRTEEARRFGIGVSSPGDMASLLEKVVLGTALGRQSCDSIVEILRRQQDTQLAARQLPFRDDSTLWIGNKTGSLDAVKNDVGIISGAGGIYVYAIFCDGSKREGEEIDNPAAIAVAQISRMLYDFLERRP